MSTIIPAADASDFLALIPLLAGCQPSRSIVMVPFRGNRTLGALRVDLPASGTDSEETDRVAATLTGLVCRISEADGVAPVVYTEESIGSAGPLPHDALVAALRSRADACGLTVTDALCVASDGWGSYLDREPARRPLEQIRRDFGDAPPGAPEVEADQLAGARLPPAPRGMRKRVGEALRRIDAAIGSASAGGGCAEHGDCEAAHVLGDPTALFEEALAWDPGDLDPADAALLLWCLGRPALRDVALTQWCSGLEAGDTALAAQLFWESGGEYPPVLAQHMWGDGPVPDAERLVCALRLVRHVAAVAPRRSSPGPLATAAWICWALGRSTHAGEYARRGLAVDSGHGLAGIVMAMVDHAHLPAWAFRARTGRASRRVGG